MPLTSRPRKLSALIQCVARTTALCVRGEHDAIAEWSPMQILLVGGDPISRYFALSAGEIKVPGADHASELFLQLVFHMGVPGRSRNTIAAIGS